MGFPTTSASGPAVPQPVVIASGQSLSPAVNIYGAIIAGIQMPANIDSATAMTFQVSYDGTTFADYYDSSGSEYSVTVAASRSIVLSAADFFGIMSLKIRLGTSGSPVTTGADRTFIISRRP